MRRWAIYFLQFIFLISGQNTVMAKKANQLINEKSPYLLQHAYNPVQWYAWGKEAFEKAKKEDKPIFLSIGYSTCHWCHVMERESFEDEAIAALLNQHFVPIKVDREERPDIDNIYMTVVVAMIGQGGWPLSVFLTPDQKPFYGGTYYPPSARWGTPGFRDVLLSIHNNWQKQKEKILESSGKIVETLDQRSREASGGFELNADTLENAYRQLKAGFDPLWGGFGQSPKFPMGHSLSFLLRYYKRTKDPESLSMVEKTLEKMAQGGMYDQLGGGFHRYSTDREWQVPHFEKMLYDQAILTRSYLEAYQATGKKYFARITAETFEYVLRDMQFQEGGFFSAEDADSLEPMDEGRETKDDASLTPHPSSLEKKEGAFYLWSDEELHKSLTKEEYEAVAGSYNIEKNGNADYDPHGEFAGKNILYQKDIAPPDGAEKFIQSAKAKLFAIRQKRSRPHLDDKILADWNGIMIAGLAFGSRVLGEKRYLEAAEKAAQFILKRMYKNGQLLHRYRDNEAAVAGTIDDYAFFVYGLLELYEASAKIDYLKEALRLSREMVKLFWDENKGGFFFTGQDSEKLILRQKEIYDGAVPSGNAVASCNLIRLYHITLDDQWQKILDRLFKAFAEEIAARPSAYAQTLWALDFVLGPAMEVVVSAAKEPPAHDMIKEISRPFLPNKVVLFHYPSQKEARSLYTIAPFVKDQPPLAGKPTVYVCKNHACEMPITDLQKLKEALG